MRFWKRIILALVLLLPFTLSFFSTPIQAANEFSVDAIVTYNVQDSGKTQVTHDITLENNVSNLYATTYTLGLENIDVAGVKAESDTGVNYPTEVTKNEEVTNIKINFPDSSVGKGVQRHFTITYENTTFAVRTGEVWEVSIPRLGDGSNFRNYQLILRVPKSFGLEAYISPRATTSTITDLGYEYIFGKSSLTQTGVSAGFGQFQVFSFNLSYHLENPLSRSSTTEIALPPDTAFQKVYFDKIEPAPTNVIKDPDGNWIATYDLSARERIDVMVTGSVQLFASYRSFPKPTNEALNNNLKESEYWQINDPRIKQLATELKTPRAIYDYVATNLKYNSARVQPNIQRLGAVSALTDPTNAICMEFTDLFVALSRAAGIPAREVEGFAYTENPDIQPLGLVADVLHSWPEYYDKDKGVWIPVDPTWGSTTGGVDFFDKLDLRHFAFVLHGGSPKEPYPPGSYKLGPNPQKDVFVSFGRLPENRLSVPKVSIKPFRVLPFFSSVYDITISNPGPAALYSLTPYIYYDSDLKTSESIEVMPPYSTNDIQITIPHSILGKDMPNLIKVAVGSSQAETLTNKKQIVVSSLLVFMVILIIVMGIVFIRVKKLSLFAIFKKKDKIVALDGKNENIIPKAPEKESRPKGL